MKNKPLTIPPRLPTSPLSLKCPYCKAGRGHDCAVLNGTPIIHVERIRMAALADEMGKLRNSADKRSRRDTRKRLAKA